MAARGNIDDTLRTLGGVGKYQVLQALAVCFGDVGAAYQLLGNIFVGRHFKWHQCSRPVNSSVTPDPDYDVDWNSSDVTYGQCEISVSLNNSSDDFRVYPCLFGHSYDFDRSLSFRTEFDLVCEHKLLGGLVQTFVILGQGVGAVINSILSDRFGRKPVMLVSQLGLLIFGGAVGFVPSYAWLAVLKFLIGAAQQGVITTMVTISMEWFPAEYRSLRTLIGATTWGLSCSSMSLVAFLMREHSWRNLQIALACASAPVFLFQWWYVDESLRWTMSNDKKEAAIRILKRAARVNRKDLKTVLNALSLCSSAPLQELEATTNGNVDETNTTSPVMTSEKGLGVRRMEKGDVQSQKISLLDLFRHRRLLFNAAIMWASWFTCAFSFFALYMMSTSLHGNRFLNYFLMSLMELIPGFLFYICVDRLGRKRTIRSLFGIAGMGLVISGVCRLFSEQHTALDTMSVAAAMLGMFGTSGMFSAIFFYTPELFPTNMRNQALGLSSFAARFGGMLSPFMVDFADVAVWAPGVLIGTLCFLVVAIMHFLPETKGRELPNTIQDIELWYQPEPTREEETHRK